MKMDIKISKDYSIRTYTICIACIIFPWEYLVNMDGQRCTVTVTNIPSSPGPEIVFDFNTENILTISTSVSCLGFNEFANLRENNDLKAAYYSGGRRSDLRSYSHFCVEDVSVSRVAVDRQLSFPLCTTMQARGGWTTGRRRWGQAPWGWVEKPPVREHRQGATLVPDTPNPTLGLQLN